MSTTINSRSTKAQLLAHIADLDAQLLAAGRTALELRTQLSIAKASAPAPRAPRVVEPRAPRQLPPHFAAAREAAMRMGVSVKVSA